MKNFKFFLLFFMTFIFFFVPRIFFENFRLEKVDARELKTGFENAVENFKSLKVGRISDQRHPMCRDIFYDIFPDVTVSVIIVFYNEDRNLQKKVRNILLNTI